MADPLFTYTVAICGGYGDKTWDREFKTQAPDIHQALAKAKKSLDDDPFCPSDYAIVGINQDD